MSQQITNKRNLFTKLFKAPFTRMLTFAEPKQEQQDKGTYMVAGGKGGPVPTADPDEYGHYPDPIEHNYGLEKKMLMGRLIGDDRYEPKIFFRNEESTYDYPNLVPTLRNEAQVACYCEVQNMYFVKMWVRKDGLPKRCECGHWFKAVDEDPDSQND